MKEQIIECGLSKDMIQFLDIEEKVYQKIFPNVYFSISQRRDGKADETHEHKITTMALEQNLKGKDLSDFLIEYLDYYWTIGCTDKINDDAMSKEDILILASIIEKEAGNDQEKLKISGVFLKRLSINMKLQADPTIIYGLLPNFDGDIKKTDILDRNNKYNTYMINGLPPTPISISSLSSIDAAIEGYPGDYLFFVADSSTSHYFSKSYKEHLNKIEELGLNK